MYYIDNLINSYLEKYEIQCSLGPQISSFDPDEQHC